jgi:hypothetical protein
MPILDTIGGLAGGLGGSGGVGGSIPSNQSAANSAANATVNPTVTLGSGAGSARDFYGGGFSVMFPGAEAQQPSAINVPPLTTSIGFNPGIAIAAIGVFLVGMFFFLRK